MTCQHCIEGVWDLRQAERRAERAEAKLSAIENAIDDIETDLATKFNRVAALDVKPIVERLKAILAE